MTTGQAYPVRVDASLDAPLSRWLWLVKWVLVIPHYIVLAFLWVAFIVLSVVAMVAIVFTGRYPRAIFEFNVGVLRWTWRVQYYAVGAFGTDRYPPFTLADDPSYPAHLEVDYPQRLSRGLALVKWWLLAIPHYIIVGLFTGSGVWAAWQYGEQQHGWADFGLIGILAVIAAVVLLVTGRYPQQIFDFVLGMNRWVLRVAGYASLMTDRYPPFRLDMGGHDPGTLTLPPPSTPSSEPPSSEPPSSERPSSERPSSERPSSERPSSERPEAPGSPALSQAVDHQILPRATGSQASPQAAPWQQEPPRRPGGWTGGRIVAVVAGAVLVLCAAGLFGGGGVALWAQANRNGGYADLGTASYTVPGYAIASDTIGLHEATGLAQHMIGTVRIRVTQANGATPVFVGIAPASAAARYLAGVDYATARGVAAHHGTYTEHAGSAPAIRPAQAHIWTAQAAGPGTQTLTWAMRSGDWMVVAMNADASRPVSLQANVAATLPALPWIAAGLLIGGFIFLAGGALLIAIPARRASAR